MPQQIRRTHAGWDEDGHHWENAGDVIEVSDSQASRLLAQPAVPLYTLVEPGATIEVEDGDPAQDAPNSEAGRHERGLAIGSRPNDPRLNTPNDNRPEDGSPNTEGSGKAATFSQTPGSLTVGASDKTAPAGTPGKADTLNAPGATAAGSDRADVPKGKQADALDGAPNAIDKTTGASGSKVVGRSESK